ncbi:hypothetical protein Hanom_Chr15g01353941 [Helianthus anomalus]
MKRIWAICHVMMEQFADVACYDERFRWEAILDTLHFLDAGSGNNRVGLLDHPPPKMDLIYYFAKP